MTQGLTEQEVRARRAAGQGNTALPATGRTYAQILRENVFTFINTILFLLGLALVAVGRPLDAVVSVGVITTNIVVSVAQEVRAKRILDRIALLNSPTATVIRDGREQAARPEDLVLGDVVKIGPGDQVVLDGHLLEGQMRVDESQLTGESDQVSKAAGDPVYSGSFCVSGGGDYVVDRVGTASLANQIAAGARRFRRVLTPLQREINLVIRIMLLIVIYLQLLLASHAVLNLLPVADAIGQATILAGLVPNGLFLSIAVAYALGAVRVIRFGALIQQANAIESLSNVDTLCLDKTGTLTTNRLQVAGLRALELRDEEFKRVLGTMTASATTQSKTSAAIAAAFPCPAQPLVAEVPFSSARKWSAVALKRPSDAGDGCQGLEGIYALGAAEFLRPHLRLSGTPTWREIADQIRTWSQRGWRVLLVAHHPDPVLLHDSGDEAQLPDDMVPLGLVALSDELRPEAGKALADFIAAGVTPKLISGDDPETVAALARQAGLGPEVRLVAGPNLADMTPAELEQAAADTTVFGRVSPRQKEQLVDALRARGHYVAMIGDGVNDVLSLKKANLAIALQGGTQAARSVSDIILVDDSFAALVPAVLEGQRITNGMVHILTLFLARISTVALVLLSAQVIGFFPLALRNNSLITFLTVGVPSVLLALWARPAARPLRSPAQDLAHIVVPVAAVSSLLGLAVFYGTLMLELWTQGLFQSPKIPLVEQDLAANVPVAQTALATFLVYCGLFLVIFVEPPTRWWSGATSQTDDRKPAVMAIALMLLFVVIAIAPPLRTLFDLVPLGAPVYGLIVAAVAIWIVLLRLIWRKRLLERFLGVS